MAADSNTPEKKVVFGGKYITVTTFPVRDQVFEEAHFRSSVCVFPVTAKGNIILLHEADPITGQVAIKPVTGFMEETDENPIAAARRELHEETGLKSVFMVELHTAEYRRLIHKQKVFCVAQGLTQEEAQPDNGEVILRTQEFEPLVIWNMIWAGRFGHADHAFGLMNLLRHLGHKFSLS